MFYMLYGKVSKTLGKEVHWWYFTFLKEDSLRKLPKHIKNSLTVLPSMYDLWRRKMRSFQVPLGWKGDGGGEGTVLNSETNCKNHLPTDIEGNVC